MIIIRVPENEFIAMGKTNQCATIGSTGKVTKTIHFEGKEYIITGTSSSGNEGLISAWGHECKDLLDYNDEIKPMSPSAQHRAIDAGERERGYRGLMVSHGVRILVMSGPQLTFKKEEPKAEKKPSTLGGQSGNGTAQHLINRVPEHNTFCTLFARHCGLFKKIKRAKRVIINDLDPAIYTMWREEFKGHRDVDILNTDAILVLQARKIGNQSLDFPSVFIYLDPPFLHHTRKRPNTCKYDFELSEAQHQTLIDAVIEFKHAKIMLNHYECPEYERLTESGWYKHRYPTMTHGGMTTVTIYMNYPPPTQLHDYRFIGADFREREAQKRIKVNMLKKLERLAPVLRNSILTDLASHFNAVDDHKI